MNGEGIYGFSSSMEYSYQTILTYFLLTDSHNDDGDNSHDQIISTCNSDEPCERERNLTLSGEELGWM